MHDLQGQGAGVRGKDERARGHNYALNQSLLRITAHLIGWNNNELGGA